MSTKEKYIKLMQSQVGYKETGVNITKYSRWFDNEGWQFFNTKKQGAEYCAIALLWALCQNDVGIGREKVRTWLGLPTPKNNAAAGVPYLWSYLVKKGYKVDKTKGEPGDFIFFNGNSHVGMIEKVANGKYTTIEANKGNAVKRCTYAITNSSICGVCRPDWSKVEPAPAPTPTPEPTPAPTPAPTAKTYSVKVNSFLSMRAAPSASAPEKGRLFNGAIVTITETANGWGKISPNLWVSMLYLTTS